MSHSSQASSTSKRRRRSSVYNFFQDMTHIGGRNSITEFASSYSRSTNFIAANFDIQHRPKTLSFGSTYTENNALLDNEAPIPYSQHHYQSNAHDIVVENDFDENRSIRSSILKGTGNSTAYQTIFNGINTLIGIGILSLPLGLYYSGWILGSIILATCALCTQYTAKLLAKCLLKNDDLKTYGDIALFSFGNIAYAIVIFTFTVDLLSAGISMIIIFADSFNALTGIDKFIFKSVISFSFFILSFVKLNVLSNLSLLGVTCTTLIVILVFFCGFVKQTAPGSLIEISHTELWPTSLLQLCLSIGIFMSPFGGHVIFAELYRDMKHPYKYNKSCTTIFLFSWLIDFLMASSGYLMFGANISDQVTKSIMTTEDFPSWVKLVVCALMGILPICKGPLITRPIISMFDQLTLRKSFMKYNPKVNNLVIKFINRMVVTSVFFFLSLIFIDFGRIISFLGSAICIAICVIYPLAFYLKTHFSELSTISKVLHCIGIVIATILAIIGTVAVIMA